MRKVTFTGPSWNGRWDSLANASHNSLFVLSSAWKVKVLALNVSAWKKWKVISVKLPEFGELIRWK